MLDTREVADVFQVPLSFVLDPANHQRDSIVRDGELHTYYVLPPVGRALGHPRASMLPSGCTGEGTDGEQREDEQDLHGQDQNCAAQEDGRTDDPYEKKEDDSRA